LTVCRESFERTYALLEHFVTAATRTTSTFHQQSSGRRPSVQHAVARAEFHSAKSAIERDLSHLLSSQPALGGDIVYSIHYADINGLSQLEKNILAHEISEYFGIEKITSAGALISQAG
jgi:hypothetical protein